jgi:hypothetical protein
MEIIMNKRLLTKPLVLLLILSIFLLASCSGAEQIPVTEEPTAEAKSQPTEAAATEAEPTKVEPTEIVATEATSSESGAGPSAPDIQMECTLVSDQPDAPADYVAIFGVTEDDRVKGPDTAAVTIVEYSDFQ